MQVLNIGSINIDHAYHVDHVVRPGETIGSGELRTAGGGKGANQTVALARAGVAVRHVGCVGPDGEWVVALLRDAGADVAGIQRVAQPTGHAMIQVAATGENSIVLFPGANHALRMADVQAELERLRPGDLVLLQNEINLNTEILAACRARGLTVCLNPAPFAPGVRQWPLEHVGILVLNETEASGLLGRPQWDDADLERLAAALPQTELIVTLGARGVLYRSATASHRVGASPVKVVDTTGAGDTFIGYFLACRVRQWGILESLALATRAAALAITRPGAISAIPSWAELHAP